MRIIDQRRGRAAYPASRKRAVIGIASAALSLWILVSVWVHRLPHDPSGGSGALLLRGAEVPGPVLAVFNHSCIDCHSDKTRWPWYSNVAPASWLIERDVQRARSHMNLSRWDSLDSAAQRTLLTAIATVIENREMPPSQYVMAHPQARLSAADSLRVIEWTHAERRRLRAFASARNSK